LKQKQSVAATICSERYFYLTRAFATVTTQASLEINENSTAVLNANAM